MIRANAVGATDTGRVRAHNEDAFHVDDDLGLYVVSDGMGGEAAGEVASRVTVDTVVSRVARAQQLLARVAEGRADVSEVVTLLVEAANLASATVHRMASAPDEPGDKGMGATLSILVVVGGKAVVCHVGDSRVSLVRDGQLHRLTQDHTMAQELAAAGLIPHEAVATHRFAHVLSRNIGSTPTTKPDTLVLDALPGDRFLLGSDGLAPVSEGDLVRTLTADDPEAVPDALITLANHAGGPDNITAVLVTLVLDGDASDAQRRLVHDTQTALQVATKLFLLDGLSLPALSRVLHACEVRHALDGQVLVDDGSWSDELFMVVGGALEVQTTDGRAVRRIPPGGAFGAPLVVAPRAVAFRLVAAGEAHLIVLTKRRLDRLVESRPRLGARLLQEIARRLADGPAGG